MGNVIILIFFLNFLFFYYLRQSVKTSNSRSSKIIMYFKIGIKYMLWYQDFGRKHPHAQQVFLLSLPLRSLDVISQGYLAVFLDFFFFFFFNKIMLPIFQIIHIQNKTLSPCINGGLEQSCKAQTCLHGLFNFGINAKERRSPSGTRFIRFELDKRKLG